jgi:hypothetical protein
VSPGFAGCHICRSFDASASASLCDRAAARKSRLSTFPRVPGQPRVFPLNLSPSPKTYLTLGDFRAQYLEQRHLESIFL